MNKRRIAAIMSFPLMVVTLMACDGAFLPGTRQPSAYTVFTVSPLPGDNPEVAYFDAQSTLTAGQSKVIELSNQATVVNLEMDQAANAAAQTTLEYHQRQLMELSIQSTEVSLNMAQAVATQQFIAQQTQMVWDATASAQSQAATATYSAYILNVTQTAQALEILNVQSTQIAQINATLTAYSLTATPWAAMQADIVRTRQEAERRALWDEFVITPIKVILVTGIVLLLIVGGVMAYQRLMPVLELRLRTIWHENDSPLLLVDGRIVDAAPLHHQLTQRELRLLEHPPQLSIDETPQVEIVDPSEPSVINWVAEAEQKLHSEGWVQP